MAAIVSRVGAEPRDGWHSDGQFIEAWAAVGALGHQLCRRLHGLGWRRLESPC